MKNAWYLALILVTFNGILLVSAAQYTTKGPQKSTSESIELDRQLVLAAVEGDPNLGYLIARGADTKIMDNLGYTPLHWAAHCGHESAVCALLSGGASIEAANRNKYTPLHVAVQQGKANVVYTLLRHDANTKAFNRFGDTPLHEAASGNREIIVCTLLRYGANLEAINASGYTPLHLAARQGYESMVRTLIRLGAKKEAVNGYGSTPLHVASFFGHESTVRALLELGARMEATNNNREMPLSVAAKRGHVSVVRVLVQAGTNLIVDNRWGQTVLEEVYVRDKNRAGNSQTLEELLKAYTNNFDQASSESGDTIVHRLISRRGPDIGLIKLIIHSSRGNVLLEQRTLEGKTPLHLAAEKDLVRYAKLLLDCGADRRAMTPLGDTADSLAGPQVRILLANSLPRIAGWVSVARGAKWLAGLLLEWGIKQAPRLPRIATPDGFIGTEFRELLGEHTAWSGLMRLAHETSILNDTSRRLLQRAFSQGNPTHVTERYESALSVAGCKEARRMIREYICTVRRKKILKNLMDSHRQPRDLARLQLEFAGTYEL